MAISLREHQTKALREMHNGCILKGDVGSGKTITSLAYYYIRVCGGVPPIKGYEAQPMTKPMDCYVITTAKKRDKMEWESDAALLGLGRESNVDGVQFHVDSWNNITQYELVDNAFFIFDEQRLVGSGAWVKAFQKIASQNQWIILSATPGDTWMDYIPVFVANGFYKNRTEFIREHVVFSRFSKFPKVERFLGEAKLDGLRAKVVVGMPDVRHTVRRISAVLAEYDAEQYGDVVKRRWNPFTEEPIKDVAELFSVVRRITNTDVSRLAELMTTLEKHPKLIVFYNFNYELEMLRTLAETLSYPVGEWNGHKHQEIPETDKWLYLVQYTAGAEGWNCIDTNAIFFWSLNYSWRVFEQAKGRIDRMNTPFVDLYYYVCRSMSPIDKAIWKAIITKQLFNEKKYAKETGVSFDDYEEQPLAA